MPSPAPRPPDFFWRHVPCGHPQDPVAWWDGIGYVCHCGWRLDATDAISDGQDEGAPGPLVPCSKCGCHVALPAAGSSVPDTSGDVATGDESPGALARTLSVARQHQGHTLRAVEAATGVHNAHLSQVERGVIKKPTLDVLAPLAAFYGLNLAMLAEWAGYSAEVVSLFTSAAEPAPSGLPAVREPDEPMVLYAAFRSVPDYHAPSPPFVSVHRTLDGAKNALYPDRPDFRAQFRKRPQKDTWEGPDGFGEIRAIEVLP